ncbi:MAG: zinc-ribbon and DUF3426 domain-containing protein [Pseudomonadota bacterium]
MFVDCPACQTRLQVRAEHLRNGRGRVCCSICQHQFDALNTLRDDEESAVPIDGQATAVDPFEADVDLAVVPTADAAETANFEMDDVQAEAAERRAVQRSRWRWGLLGAGASVLLALQIILVFGPRWAADPGWRPLLTWGCARLHAAGLSCVLPPLVDIRQMTLEGHRFTTHPQRAGGLLFEADLVNHAAFAQGYPRIRLSVEDPWGGAVAIGTFGPETYLAESAAAERPFAPDAHVPIRLELLDPGGQAAGYRFELLAPD